MDTCFLLTSSYFDRANHFEIELFAVSTEKKAVKIVIDSYHPLFFIPRATPAQLTQSASERRQLPLRAMDGNSVDCLYFRKYADYRQSLDRLHSRGIRTYESDINPCARYLMERFICGGFTVNGTPKIEQNIPVYTNPVLRGTDIDISLRTLSFDIETNSHTGNLYSIACCGKSDVVFIIGAVSNPTVPVVSCKDERELLTTFFAHIQEEDPDILIGWNVINFDLFMIRNRCLALGVPFEPGRERGAVLKPEREGINRYFANLPGRVVLDVPVMLRINQYSFESYSLNSVASAMLGKTKTVELSGSSKIEEINRLFREERAAFCEYNLRDAQLTLEIFDHSSLAANAIERSKLSGRLLNQFGGGSIASFDHLYLPRLHREGHVAGNIADIPRSTEPLPGGYVIEPKPGIYEHVLSFDFKSLYPTIIMTFLIDPLGSIVKSGKEIAGPTGHAFSKETSILPGIISELLAARSRAKEQNNQPLSLAIKILMNSFYGVLGSTGCRFFSPHIAQAITETGQYILKSTRAFIEQSTSCSVIYGDTDSLFVLLDKKGSENAEETARTIVTRVNSWLTEHLREQFNATSRLELEFETHFRHFFMPALRGTTQGSKKRHCGTVEREGDLLLQFKGLESARSDWTALAKEFQYTLYKKVFQKEPVKEYIIETVNSVRKGEVDGKLIYRKQLRKPVDEYTTHVPPHAQAAKLLKQPGRTIRYCITTNGPQPTGHITAPLDYEHYIECQLRPVADSILEWINLDFTAVASGQQNLFDAL